MTKEHKILQRYAQGVRIESGCRKGKQAAMSIAWSMGRQDTIAPANWSETRGFLENLAHDLRQPLGDIEMIAYHLQTCAALEPGQAREMLGKIRRLVAQTSEILCGSLQAAEHPSAEFAATQRPLTGFPVPPAGA